MPRQRSAQPRYRRRVVLELTPDESTVLDRLADRLGTIRGAVLAGLRELETNRSAELEADAGDLRKRLERAEGAARAERKRATADLASLNEQLAVTGKALEVAQRETTDARADLRAMRAKLTNEAAARRAALASGQAAEALLVHHAYCATCDKLVPEAEWAEEPWRSGFAVYHKAHPFRDKAAFLGQPASMLFWRAQPSAGARR